MTDINPTISIITSSISGLNILIKRQIITNSQWLIPVILPTKKAEIRMIEVQSQPRANSSQDTISKKIYHKKGLSK
jgi:hypothetical protein